VNRYLFNEEMAVPGGAYSGLSGSAAPRQRSSRAEVRRETGFEENRGRSEPSVSGAGLRGAYHRDMTAKRDRVEGESRVNSGTRHNLDDIGSQTSICGQIRNVPVLDLEKPNVRSGRSSRSRRRQSPPDYSSSSSEDRDTSRSLRSKRYTSSVKLGSYQGDTCLETFLVKFENLSRYANWKEKDRLFHLCAALEGPAGQILWDAGEQTTVREIINRLRVRFGTGNQAERFRAELRVRRRKADESLQSLYQDVCRLLALAYPGPTNSTTTLVGRDAFLDALNNPAMRIRILEKEPTTLEEALTLACRLEAYDRAATPAVHEERESDKDRGRVRHFRQVAAAPETSDRTEELMQQIRALQAAVSQLSVQQQQRAHHELMTVSVPPVRTDQSVPQSTSAGVAWYPSVQSVPVSAPLQQPSDLQAEVVSNLYAETRPGWQFPTTGTAVVDEPSSVTHSRRNNGSRRRNRTSDQCRQCGGLGHWRRDCPQLQQRNATNTTAGRVNQVTKNWKSGEVYVQASIDGNPVKCLLDTGCDRSIIGRRLIPNQELSETDTKLFAANGNEIPLLGTTTLSLQLAGLPVTVKFAVSDLLDEAILGIDWLSAQKCLWDFSTSTLRLYGHQIKLFSRPSQAQVRRIYVSNETVVQPGCQANVPVKLALHSLRTPSSDWVMESKALSGGVVLARTLIGEETEGPAVRVINYSRRPYRFPEGLCLGKAEPAVVCEHDEEAGTESSVRTDLPVRTDHLCTQTVSTTGISLPVCTGSEHLVTDGMPLQETRSLVNVEDLQHVQCVIDCLPDDLTEEQRCVATEFIRNRKDVFSASEFDLGRTDLVQHRIDTGNNRPFKQQLRRHPLAYLSVIDDHVNDMLRNDVIEPAASPWTSNVVLVRKPDGSLRFCIDYRRLNLLTYKDNYPLPRIDTCLQSFGGCKFFSTLDLRAGYWQTVIDPRDRDKTAFVTRRGTFRFKVLSFGLANAPALFQRLMDLVLVGLTWETCLVYLDDVIIYARSFDEHVERLAIVFDRLKAANLKLKPSKCHLFQRRVTFLGHVVSESGIEPDPDKIQIVKTWPRPERVTDVRSFVGLASYYRNHIQNFAAIARPLHELTRKGERFTWGERQEQAFNQLKEKLTTAPVLAAPCDDGTYILDTDASDYGLGAVLQQVQNGVIRVIAYGSRTLSNAERTYCTSRKEMLALVWGLSKYRQFLLGREIIIRTDHGALVHLQKTPEPIGQQARWLDILSEFNFSVQHRPGNSHQNADALSRRPCERETDQLCRQCHRSANIQCCMVRRRPGRSQSTAATSSVHADPSVPAAVELTSVQAQSVNTDGLYPSMPSPTTVNTENCPSSDVSGQELQVEISLFGSDRLREAQQRDADIAPVLEWRRTSAQRPAWSAVAGHGDETRTYGAQWDSLVIHNNVLYRKFIQANVQNVRLQIILPFVLRTEFICQCHEGSGGHSATRRTQYQVQLRAYWVGWRKCVEEQCQR
jgi:hypothetical protein